MGARCCNKKAVFALVVGALASSGCFRSPDKGKLSCTTSARCPSGWQCVVPSGLLTGLCAPVASNDAAMDGIAGAVDAPESDVPGGAETAMALDMSVDQPSSFEVNGTLDVPSDSPLSAPDVGVDLAIDLATLRGQGEACSTSADCHAGLACADGLCCDKACSGCFACSAALNGAKDGTCLPVPSGQVAHDACKASGSPCGLDGTCDGSGSCRLGAKGAPCGSACSGSTLTVSACDGAGACTPGTPQPCSGSLILLC